MIKKIFRVLGFLFVLALIAGVAAWVYFDEEQVVLDADTRAVFEKSANETFVELPSGIVHYQLAGPIDAELVVLVHGFSVPSYIWDPTFSALTDAGYRVLRFDLFGRGHSDRPDADYSIRFFADQLSDVVEKLQLESPFNLIGLSMGGPIVTRFTNANASRVKRLVLVDPMVFAPTEDEISPLNIPWLGEYLANVYLIPRLAAGQVKAFENPSQYADWGQRFREQMQYRGFRRAILSTIRQWPQTDTLGAYRQLGKLSMPVKLYWGRQDKTIPLIHSEKLLELVPRASLQIIEDAGHISHFERPEVFNPSLLAFFGE